jgi:hypothetical protein
MAKFIKTEFGEINMVQPLGTGIIVSIISAIGFFLVAMKQKHYVRKDDAVIMGLGLIGNGISLVIFNSNLFFYGLPLAVFPLVQAIAGIGLTIKNEDIGYEIILRGWTCFAMAIFIILVQFNIINF